LHKAISLPKHTANPGILGHAGWIYNALHKHIRVKYAGFLAKYEPREVFLVIALTETEVALLRKGSNFMLPTFEVGYEHSKDA
jgi:hypothetical protein